MILMIQRDGFGQMDEGGGKKAGFGVPRADVGVFLCSCFLEMF